MSALTEWQAKKICEALNERAPRIVWSDTSKSHVFLDEGHIKIIRGVLDANQALPALETNVAHPATPENIERLPRDKNVNEEYSVDVLAFFTDRTWTVGIWNFVRRRWEYANNCEIIICITHFMIPEVK